eukprot:scaffold1054_cov116-Isochrysis_galbana.AAC.19
MGHPAIPTVRPRHEGRRDHPEAVRLLLGVARLHHTRWCLGARHGAIADAHAHAHARGDAHVAAAGHWLLNAVA